MSRSRAQIDGGYVRKTVSLPAGVATEIANHLLTRPGVTMSLFVTEACESMLKKIGKKMA